MIAMENLVREVLTEQTGDLYLGHDAASRALRAAPRRRFKRRRVVLMAVSAAAFAVGVAGIAAAAGVMPWWHSVQTMRSAMNSPFVTSADPAAVPGSTVRLTVPGPASTTFEVVTNTVTVATGRADCTAIAVKDAQGRSQQLMSSCGVPGAAVAAAGSFDWQAPSGATYAIIAGPTPTSTAAKVALLVSNGLTATTEPVAGGYYLVYAPARLSTGSLVFYDARGQVVDELALHPHP
jgi:hypothetical protein